MSLENINKNLLGIKDSSAELQNSGINDLKNNTTLRSCCGELQEDDDCNTTECGRCVEAEGCDTKAVGDCSHAEGCGTKALGNCSHSEGSSTVAAENNSHAEGCTTKTFGNCSHAEGSNTIAYGDSSHAEGYNTKTRGTYAHAEGYSSEANGSYSHAQGYSTKAEGFTSNSKGEYTTARGEASSAEGYSTTAESFASHAEGGSTTARGSYSHAEGANSLASGSYAHAEGYGTTASGSYAHAEGYSNIADGYASHAEGYLTAARAPYAHAEGYSTDTKAFNGSQIMGLYGDADTPYSWFLAGGTSSARALAAKILYTGYAYITNAWNAGGSGFAEMYPSLGGQTINPGYFVTLDGENVKIAKSSDNYILGVTSVSSGFVANNGELGNDVSYLTSSFGEPQYEDVTIQEKKDDKGNILVPEHVLKMPIQSTNLKTNGISMASNQCGGTTVTILGQVIVMDDGTCTANGYCLPNDDGIATASREGYRVMKRVSDNQILILFRG